MPSPKLNYSPEIMRNAELKPEKEKAKLHSVEDLKSKFYGSRGTPARERYEYELSVEIIGEILKDMRLSKNMTQEELGNLIGVGKSQISKLESSATDIRLGTILKVFKALQAKIKFEVETSDNKELELIMI